MANAELCGAMTGEPYVLEVSCDLPPIAPALFIGEGRSLAWCHLQMQAGPVMPGRTASGLIVGNGG